MNSNSEEKKTLIIVDTSADTVYMKEGTDAELKAYAVRVMLQIVEGEDDEDYLEMFWRGDDIITSPPELITWEQLGGCLLDLAFYLLDGDTPPSAPVQMLQRHLPTGPIKKPFKPAAAPPAEQLDLWSVSDES